VGAVTLSATALLLATAHSLILLRQPLGGDLLSVPRGRWVLAAASAALFLAFLLLLPVRVRRDWRPHGLYMAFVVSLFAEMFGFPLTAYLLSSALGWTLFEREFMGYMYRVGMPVGSAITLVGVLLVVLGWRELHRGRDDLVTTGVYRCLRHPQYLGLVLVTAGWLVHWPTLPGLLMWPLLTLAYVRQARREERALAQRYGPAYDLYVRQTPGWMPRCAASIRSRIG
jgi:protein-S-isoprenylcysteine O-methyltransferase Ste14